MKDKQIQERMDELTLEDFSALTSLTTREVALTLADELVNSPAKRMEIQQVIIALAVLAKINDKQYLIKPCSQICEALSEIGASQRMMEEKNENSR